MAIQPSISSHPGLFQEEELWSHRDEAAARSMLAERFLPFAKSIALRYKGRAEDVDDLIQVANLGLMKAIDRFDPERGYVFMAFASSTIHGELKRHFRDRVSTVRLPRSIYERIGDIEAVSSDLRHELRREPSPSEIAEALGCPVEEVLDSFGATKARHPLPLQFESEDEDGLLEERVGAEDEAFGLTDDRLAVGMAIAELGPEDRTLLEMRFGADLPQREIGARLGCSQMNVSRRLRRLLDGLNEKITAPTE